MASVTFIDVDMTILVTGTGVLAIKMTITMIIMTNMTVTVPFDII